MLNHVKFTINMNIRKNEIYDDLSANIPYNVFVDKYGYVTIKKFSLLKHDAFLHNKLQENFNLSNSCNTLSGRRSVILGKRCQIFESMTTTDAEKERQMLKEAVEICNTALNNVLNIIDRNIAISSRNRRKVAKYDDDMDKYKKQLDSVTKTCTNISNDTITLHNDDDGNCYKAGDYGRMEEVRRINANPSCVILCEKRDVCAYVDPSNARKSCITARMKLTKPTKPVQEKLIPVPEITCQICPNIMDISADSSGNVSIDGVISQTNNCIIEKEMEIAALDNIIANKTDESISIPTIFSDYSIITPKNIAIVLVVIILIALIIKS